MNNKIEITSGKKVTVIHGNYKGQKLFRRVENQVEGLKEALEMRFGTKDLNLCASDVGQAKRVSIGISR